jgi:serine/threonine-protein kinase
MASPPNPPPSNRARAAVIAGIVVLALLVGVGTALVVRGWSAGEPASGVAVPPASSDSAAPALPAEPGAALQTLRGADAGTAEALVGSWAPQLSAKKPGLVVDGQTYDAAAILADHQRLQAEQPGTILVWSGDYTSFRSRDFWITLANRPFATSEEANAWCASAGYGSDDCYAKRLSHTGDHTTHTALRSGAGSGSGVRGGTVPGGAEPVLGGDRWAPDVIGFGDVRPREINANGDPTSYAVDITWESWGGSQAIGRGTAGWYPPDGYASDTELYPAVIVAYDLGDCGGRLGYRSVGWYFPTQGDTSLSPGDGYRDICEGP